MKNFLFILLITISCSKAKNNKNNFNQILKGDKAEKVMKRADKSAKSILQKHYEKEKIVLMDKITLSEFINILKIQGNSNDLNFIITKGKTNIEWIKEKDLDYLISIVDSKEKAKCINRLISSHIPDSENMTIGNQVISIIESYRNREPYPNNLCVCIRYNNKKREEILKWWKQRKTLSVDKK